AINVLLKPGVMDPVAQTVVEAARDLGMRLEAVRKFRRYILSFPAGQAEYLLFDRNGILRKLFANEAIEQIIDGPLSLDPLALGAPYTFRLVTVALRALDDDRLMKLSHDGQLALNPADMLT